MREKCPGTMRTPYPLWQTHGRKCLYCFCSRLFNGFPISIIDVRLREMCSTKFLLSQIKLSVGSGTSYSVKNYQYTKPTDEFIDSEWVLRKLRTFLPVSSVHILFKPSILKYVFSLRKKESTAIVATTRIQMPSRQLKFWWNKQNELKLDTIGMGNLTVFNWTYYRPMLNKMYLSRFI